MDWARIFQDIGITLDGDLILPGENALLRRERSLEHIIVGYMH